MYMICLTPALIRLDMACSIDSNRSRKLQMLKHANSQISMCVQQTKDHAFVYRIISCYATKPTVGCYRIPTVTKIEINCDDNLQTAIASRTITTEEAKPLTTLQSDVSFFFSEWHVYTLGRLVVLNWCVFLEHKCSEIEIGSCCVLPAGTEALVDGEETAAETRVVRFHQD